MSTNQRRHRGEADYSGQAPEESRLLAPCPDGASEPETEGFEESGTFSFELAGEEFIGVAADAPDSEGISVTASDSGSVVQWEQSQQHPLVSRAADNSAVLLASADDVEPRDSDGAWSSGPFSSPVWMDEFSEREHNQEYPLLPTPVGDSVGILARDDEDNYGLFVPLTDVPYKEFSLWQLDQNQQHPLFSRAAECGEQRGQPLLKISVVDDEDEDEDEYGYEYEDLDEYGYEDDYEDEGEDEDGYEYDYEDEDETTDYDVSVTDSTPEEGDSSEDETESSDAWPAGIVRCPICMDFYPQIVQSGKQVLSTLCGHVFCSQCLPFALQTASFCPTCRTDLTPEQYHPIYI